MNAVHAIDARTPTLAEVPVATTLNGGARYAGMVIINVRGCRAVVTCSLVVVEKDEGVKRVLR